MTDVLPSCIARERKTVVRAGQTWIPLFCANCGADGGLVLEQDLGDNFAFYLCDPCAEKWGPIAGMTMVPDEVFWAKVRDAQMEEYGRILTPEEQGEQLKDGDSLLSKLARERYTK